MQSTENLAHSARAPWVPPSLITFRHRASVATSGMLGVVGAKDFKWEQEGLLPLCSTGRGREQGLLPPLPLLWVPL